MDLYLRKVIYNQSDPDGYRVILKDDGDKVEIGSISVQHSAGGSWSWAIDTVIPMRLWRHPVGATTAPTVCGSSKRRGPGLRLMRQT